MPRSRPHVKRLWRSKKVQISLASLVAVLFLAGCGGGNGGDEGGLVTVQFADSVFVSCPRDCWGQALQQRIDSGEVTCGEVTDNTRCRSHETSAEAADWVPEGAISYKGGP